MEETRDESTSGIGENPVSDQGDGATSEPQAEQPAAEQKTEGGE
jgi:hypothetical protein